MKNIITLVLVAFLTSNTSFAESASPCESKAETSFQLCMGHGVKEFLLPVSNAFTRVFDRMVMGQDVQGAACKEKRVKEIERCKKMLGSAH